MAATGKDEVLFEFVVQGNVVKATAIHAASGTEASIVGPAGAARETLGQAALRKLQYVMAKKV
jgi:ABC-type transport system involved in Fe-S cluster assembly fused permease/ATPase subunit